MTASVKSDLLKESLVELFTKTTVEGSSQQNMMVLNFLTEYLPRLSVQSQTRYPFAIAGALVEIPTVSRILTP